MKNIYCWIIELPEFVWGTLFGALLSALISWRIQIRAFKWDKKIRDAEYNRFQKTLGKTLYIKLKKIDSNFNLIHEVLVQSENSPSQMGPWACLEPFGYLPDAIRISYEELGLLHNLGNEELFSKITNMEAIHKNLMGNMKRYDVIRSELCEKLPANYVVGTMVGSDLNYDELGPKIRAEINRINQFIMGMKGLAIKGIDKSNAVMELSILLQSKLGLSINVELEK